MDGRRRRLFSLILSSHCTFTVQRLVVALVASGVFSDLSAESPLTH